MILLIATCTWTSKHQVADMSSFFAFSVTVILIMMGAVGVYQVGFPDCLISNTIQSYLYGMAADLPPIYTSAIVIGTNAGGVLASLLYIFCTPSKQTWNTELQSAKVYYSVTFAYLALCMGSLFVFWRSVSFSSCRTTVLQEMFRHYMSQSEIKSRQTSCSPRNFCKDFGEVFCGVSHLLTKKS